jgi:hypothetical protein
MKRFVFRLSALGTLVCVLCLAWGTAFAAETNPWELTNKSSLVIQKIEMTPDGKTDEAQTVEQEIANGQKAVIQRPGGGLMRVVITHADGELVFPVVSFYEQKNAKATLGMVKPNVPELQFFDGKDLQAAFYGDNSAWGIEQALGAFPYAPGVTTLGKAMEWGNLKQDATNKQVLTGIQKWENQKWKLTLTFNGPDVEDALLVVEMRVADDGGKTFMIIEDALVAHGYVCFRKEPDKKMLNVYEFEGEGEGAGASYMNDAVSAAYWKLVGEGTTPSVMLDHYVPQGVFDALADAHKNGQKAEDALDGADGLVVSVLHAKKTYTITMRTATGFAGLARK